MRFGHLVLLGVTMLAACGKLTEEEFVYSYTDTYCARWLECIDPAVAAFDGIDSTDACEAEVGEDLASMASNCKLVRKNAEDCLTGVSSLTCPEDGSALEDNLPTVCTFVWKSCALTAEDPDEDASE